MPTGSLQSLLTYSSTVADAFKLHHDIHEFPWNRQSSPQVLCAGTRPVFVWCFFRKAALYCWPWEKSYSFSGNLQSSSVLHWRHSSECQACKAFLSLMWIAARLSAKKTLVQDQEVSPLNPASPLLLHSGPIIGSLSTDGQLIRQPAAWVESWPRTPVSQIHSLTIMHNLCSIGQADVSEGKQVKMNDAGL